jgi:ATP phosphoribosyltransferase regulatory subunit
VNIEPPVDPQALKAIRAPFLEFGAVLIEPATLQPLNLLLDLTGETMRARLFVVQDEGGREACLRPDFTLAVANAHVQAGGGQGLYRYEGKAFRVSPPHIPHAEEFTQIGLEGFGGPSGPSVDAGLVVLAWRSARAGGRDDLTIRLGDMGLFDAFLAAIEVSGVTAARLRRTLASPRALAAALERAQTKATLPDDPLAQRLMGLPRVQAINVLEDAWAEKLMQPIGGRTAAEVVDRLAGRVDAARAPRLTSAQAQLISRYAACKAAPRESLAQLKDLAGGMAFAGAVEDWTERLDVMVKDGLPEDRMTFDAGFGRAFSYYDGFLFEITSTVMGADAPVAAGGRYDSLLGRLSGVPGTAVGCIVRPARAWVGGPT